MSEIIKAISLWQPWASLWLSSNKIHETRHWATKHRGPLLVHAAKKIVFDLDDELSEIVCSEFGGHWAMDLPRGAIIGMVGLEDCIPTERLYMKGFLDLEDLACGDFSAGRFGWRRSRGWKLFVEPVPYRGHQGLFNVPLATVEVPLATARVCFR